MNGKENVREFDKLKQILRCLTLLSVLCLLTVLAAAASTGYAIDSFDAESGQITVEAAETSTLAVAMYAADGQLLWLDQQRVSGEQTLSLNLPEDRPEGCVFNAFLLDPETLAPRCPSAAQGGRAEDSGNYAVTELTTDGDRIIANVSADGACTVLVEVLSEDLSAVLASGTAEITEAMELQDVPVEGFAALPDYYALRGVLLDGESEALCSPYVTIRYTEAYARFEAKTPADFPDNLVLDYGSNGFGVLVDGAKEVPGIAVALNAERTAFSIPASAMPQVGDVLVLTEEHGVQSPLKVGAVTDNGDGTVTVTMDENAGMSDLYRLLKLDASLDMGQAIEDNGTVLLQDDKPQVDENLDLFKISQGFELGPMKVDVSGTVRAVVKASYAPEFFGEEYYEVETYTQTDMEATMSFTADFDPADFLKDELGYPIEPEFVLYDGPVTFVGGGLVGINLNLTVPWDARLEGGGKITATMLTKSGTKTNSVSEPQKIKSSDASGALELYGKASAEIGLKVSVEAFLLMGVFEGEVSCDAGVGVNLMPVYSVDDDTTGAKTHACKLCLDGEFYWYYGFHAGLKLDLIGDNEVTLASVDLLSGKHTLGEAYCSVINDVDSLFGGELHFGWGECPNYKYRVITSTVNASGETVSGIPVTIAGAKDAQGPSPYKVYLYDGEYSASAQFESGLFSQDFTVYRDAVDVTVKEEETVIKGLITDGVTKEPLRGAQVQIRWPDGRMDSTVTAADGTYEMVVIPDGKAAVTASAADHRTRTVEQEIHPGRVHAVNMELMPACRITLNVVDQEGKPCSGVTVTGTKLENDPVTGSDGVARFEVDAGEYTFAVTNKNGSAYKTMEVAQDTELTLTLQSDFMEWSFDEETGKLTINGLGPMPNYYASAPWAAHNSQIRSIEIIGMRTIGSDAFDELPALTTVVLPETLKTIGGTAFEKCGKLEEIRIPDAVTRIGSDAFLRCTSLKTVQFGDGLESIGTTAFAYSGITEVRMPESLRTIENYCFKYCTGLQTVSIPGHPEGTSVNLGAFEGCSALQVLTLGEGVRSVGSYVFRDCTELRTIWFTEGLTSIGSEAFADCEALEKADLPDSLQTLSSGAFKRCASMNSVTFGFGLSTIGNSAFAGSGLQSVIIPENIKLIENYAFDNCDQLLTAEIKGNEDGTTINHGAFEGCNNLWKLTLGNGVKSLGSNTFHGCVMLTDIEFPETLTSISSEAFLGCSELPEVDFPDSLTKIGDNAFKNCEKLAAIRWGSGVSSIGAAAFANCGLTQIAIPSCVTLIGNYAFENCDAAGSISIAGAESGTVVNLCAFKDCDAVRWLTLGNTVTSLGSSAFQSCDLLGTIDLGLGLQFIGSDAFNACVELSSVRIPDSVTSLGERAFANCGKMGSVTIGSGLGTIGAGAFHASGLTSVLVPANVTTIGNYAFADCPELAYASVSGNENGTAINLCAFENCKKLSSVSLGAGVVYIGSSAFSRCDALSHVSYGGTAEQWASIDIKDYNDALLDAYQGA